MSAPVTIGFRAGFSEGRDYELAVRGTGYVDGKNIKGMIFRRTVRVLAFVSDLDEPVHQRDVRVLVMNGNGKRSKIRLDLFAAQHSLAVKP